MSNLETEGIQINVSGETKQVFLTMCHILGDNLGLNSVLDFTKSFNANYYCRMCKRSQENMKSDTRENIYNIKKYLQDLSIDEELERVKQTGIKENSIFNKIPSIHVLNNVTFDFMHDLLKGICHYDLSTITYFKRFYIYLKKKMIRCI